MELAKHKFLVLLVLGTASVLLKGCNFDHVNCDGSDCSCTWTLDSSWARIFISGVAIEHSSRVLYIRDVVHQGFPASGSETTFLGGRLISWPLGYRHIAACCADIFYQIDYDERKTFSMPNKTMRQFRTSCSNSPNKEIAFAAGGHNASMAVARRLSGLRKSFPLWQQAAHPNENPRPNGKWQPTNDGQEGQDCVVKTTHGFRLNTVLISSGSMTLRIKGVDPEIINPARMTCCMAMRPLLESVYLNGTNESEVPADIRNNFCSACKGSPNQGVALAAYRCFSAGEALDVAV